MSGAIEVRQQPIRVRIRPPNACTAALCDTPAAAYVAWLTHDWAELRAQAVCVMHATWARSVGGCLVLPAGTNLDVLAAQVQQEVNRRPTPRYFNPTINFTATTGTSTGWW